MNPFPVFIDSIESVAPTLWNRLLGANYPFLRHEYLLCLEKSGATSSETGWRAHHLVVYRQSNDAKHSLEEHEVIAVVPLFLKSHSFAEYVFDFAWAHAYQEAGLSYYPKLVSCAPFAPDPGPRFLIDPSFDTPEFLAWIIEQIEGETVRIGASGVHCLFGEANFCHRLHEHGWHRRIGCQFHWFNRGYSSFDGFLASLASRKRKMVKNEQRRVAQQGIEVRVEEGPTIRDATWEAMVRFYRTTYLKLSGRKGYLNAAFFHELGRSMPQNIVLFAAYRENRIVAGALCFRDSQALYGRYWGCDEEVECLHFELCYYQGIKYAIEHGLARFEPGAQGEHKIARGFEPTLIHSNHWLVHPSGRRAIETYLEHEALEVQAYCQEARQGLPFRSDSETS